MTKSCAKVQAKRESKTKAAKTVSGLEKPAGKRYLIQKRPSHPTGIVYFLRCLWHLLEDDKSKDIIYWKPDAKDKFVIPDEKALDIFFKDYDGFKSNMSSFRRSLYFYGFKKVHNVWFHVEINKDDKDSLKNVRRQVNTKKNKALKLRNQYFELMFAQMRQMNPQFAAMHMHSLMKHPLSPTYIPTIPSNSTSGTTSHSPENQELFGAYNPELMMNAQQMQMPGQPELAPMMTNNLMSVPYYGHQADELFDVNAVNSLPVGQGENTEESEK